MLLLNNLEFKRLDKIIFNKINISASAGKIILINGNNGAGKTTLLKTIVNILEPTNGEIFWMGKKIKKNLFNFYSNTTFIMDKPTSSKTLKHSCVFGKDNILNISSRIRSPLTSLILSTLDLRSSMVCSEISKFNSPYNHMHLNNLNGSF